MCFELYRQSERTSVFNVFPLSLSLSLFLPGPPVVVMGRDLSAHLMQLMFACAWGHEHRDTHSPDTHSAPLSPSVTTLSHSLSSPPPLPFLALPLSFPSCITHSLPASSPTLALHPVSWYFSFSALVFNAAWSFLGHGYYNHLHLPYYLGALVIPIDHSTSKAVKRAASNEIV